MNKYFKQVLSALKTRKEFKALGFSRKEQKGIAAKVADKLDLKEDASDDDVSDAIDDAIDSIMPILEITNASADRRLNSYKEAHPDSTDDDDPDDDDPTPATGKTAKTKKSKEEKDDDKNMEDSPMFKAIKELTDTVKGMKGEISELKSNRTTDTRRSKVEEILKNTGKFGERNLKAFSRMSFKDDDEFEDYLDDLKADLEDVNKERSQDGLDALGHIPSTDNDKGNKEPKIMTAEEVKELANS